ncbi:transglycosylase family protein [Nocardia miyunensis]|uniref:transglycosylase family protein n=1 Tax=Nocardia miyunensis TaxID=282684 RepID=UPI00082B8AC2|nr:transglycosylase family protein [Nocardia miyunensis]
MSGRHRKPTNTGRTVAKVAVTSAMMGGAGVALAGHAAAAPDADWDKLAQCESGGNWGINTGNGFHGGLQFTPSTWASYGGTQYASSPEHASKDQQIAVAEKVLATQGWGAWPSCSSHLGLHSGATQRTAPATSANEQATPRMQAQPELATHSQAPVQQQQAAPDGSQQVFQTVDKGITIAQQHGIQLPQQAMDAYKAAKASGVKLDPSVVNFFEANKSFLPN